MKATRLLAPGFFAVAAVLVFQAAGHAAAPTQPAPPADPAALDFFETRVRPVLAGSCYSCHGEKRQSGGLRLDSRAALLEGGTDGPVVVPGDPEKSTLVRVLRRDGDVKMPPRQPLPPEAVAALTDWVKMGLPWPSTVSAPTSVAATPATHWAFQPVHRPSLPPAAGSTAPNGLLNPIDAFILARLQEKGLTLAPPADRRTLIRRLSFDLLGLPPTPEEVAAFEHDPSPDAYSHLVDRLLASPHYGERWGRYWLDIARYADTKGYVFTEERRYPYAYTYRDYVIRAFNEDLPYDRFLMEQLAADRLDLGTDKRPLAALGFLTLGRRFLNNPHDIIDDRIDVTTRGLLGLTVACARCHDHKFDPIPQKDYYSLYGVFASSVEPKDLPLMEAPERTPAYLAFEKELQAREAKVTAFQEEHKAELSNRKVRDELTALRRRVQEWQVDAPAAPPRAMVLEDAPVPQTPHVFLRGNPNNPGPEVPRQFLQVLAGDKRQPFHQGSGRLELAQAIASRDNPLTARVLVNRVWMHHFGQGLVRTPGNFGLRGDAPTHPELLDYLASTFMDQGWSIKQLHRLILLSNTYQQSSEASSRAEQIDPENRLLSHMNRRRLDFEALRDSLLAVAGRLDAQAGGRPVDLTTSPFSPRRSVYGLIDRQNLPGLFRTFDFASPDATSPQRHETTVPQQALFLMNSPFLIEQARSLASRAEVTTAPDEASRIDRLYRLLYGRSPEPEEVELGRRFLAARESGPQGLSTWEEYAQVLMLANEFAFVD